MVGEFRYKKILKSIQGIDFIIGAFFMELIYLYLTYENSSTFLIIYFAFVETAINAFDLQMFNVCSSSKDPATQAPHKSQAC